MGREIVGLDALIFIYFLEENQRYIDAVEPLFQSIQTGKVQGVFAAIGMIELLTGVKRRNRYDLAKQYRQMIAHFPNLSVRSINEAVVDLASDLRAKYRISTPDAIHIATAIEAGAQRFITNDRKLKQVKEIPVELLR